MDGELQNANGFFFNDVLVGAPSWNGGRGKVYLFSGTSTGFSTPAFWTFSGSQANTSFGFSVKGDLDLDNAGFNSRDLVVGAPDYDGTYANQGRVYVFRNFTNPGSGWTATPTTLDTTAPQANARLGYCVAGGDVDNGGRDDVIVGAPYYGANSKGRVFIFWGRSNQEPNPIPEELNSGQPTMTGEHFGSSVAFLPKITPPCIFAFPCLAGGAPEGSSSGFSNNGLVTVFQFEPAP